VTASVIASRRGTRRGAEARDDDDEDDGDGDDDDAMSASSGSAAIEEASPPREPPGGLGRARTAPPGRGAETRGARDTAPSAEIAPDIAGGRTLSKEAKPREGMCAAKWISKR
jgi:hypothetical protein